MKKDGVHITLKERESGIHEIRKGVEQQFRYKLYQDPKFPFLQAMGTNHLFQSFQCEEFGYIGTLHLWYSNESGEPSYQTAEKQFLSGYWKSEWIEDAREALDMAIEIERSKPYTEKLEQIHLKDSTDRSEKIARELLEKRYKKDMQKATEESEKVLWN